MHRKHIVLAAIALGVLFGWVLALSYYVGDTNPTHSPAVTLSYTLEGIFNRLRDSAMGAHSTYTEPTSGPGMPTMHILNDIIDETQFTDNNSGGTPGTDDSGGSNWRLQTGAAAKHADPPCFDNVNRYVDCGNGTVMDQVTGLMWLKNANCFGCLSYAAANNAAAGLEHGECGLTDSSSPGDWRLPTKEEWEEIVLSAREMGCNNPCLTNTPGTGCYSSGPQPFTGVQASRYWSSTTDKDTPGLAWRVRLDSGYVFNVIKINSYYIWPVRGGQ